MWWPLLVLAWASPLVAGTQLVVAASEIAATRFGEGDLDGDGQGELVVGGRVGPFRPVTDAQEGRRARIEVQVYQRGQLQTIAALDELPVVADIAVADIDGDDRAEILAIGWHRLWTLRLERGKLVVAGEQVLAAGRLVRVAAADLDGDGRAEVILAERRQTPVAEVVVTTLGVYRYGRQWQEVSRLDLDGDVGDLCLGQVAGRPSLALELGTEEIGGLVQTYAFDGLVPRWRADQQLTRDHIRALNLDLRSLAGRALLVVGDIAGSVALLQPLGLRWVGTTTVAAPPGPLRGLHLTQLFDAAGVQLLGASGLRGAVWMADGF